eukprot:7007169-Prymnesium_polylepis.1
MLRTSARVPPRRRPCAPCPCGGGGPASGSCWPGAGGHREHGRGASARRRTGGWVMAEVGRLPSIARQNKVVVCGRRVGFVTDDVERRGSNGHMAAHGSTWQHMAAHGSTWQHMRHGSTWHM